MRIRCKLNMTIPVAVSLASLGLCDSAQALWFGTYGSWDSQTRQDAANAALTAVCDRFNVYGDFNWGSDGWCDVYYNAGVPTANASWAGAMTFGGTWPNQRVSLHEMNHWLGSVYGHGMNGARAIAILEQFDGVGARFGSDGTHFWPYGMNYDSEWSEVGAQRNIAIMYAQRGDWGVGPTVNPAAWAATSVTLTASDAGGESGFNFGSKWSDTTFAHSNAAYATGAFSIRTPQGYPSWKFAGASLTVNATGQLLYNGWGTDGVVTINGLTLDGGTIKHDQFAQDLFQLGGNMTLAAAGGTVNAANGNIKILAPIGGTGSLTKSGAYTTTLSNINTFTAGTVVNAGTLILANGGTAGGVRGALTINSGAAVKLSAGDALGWGDAATAVTQVTINGGTLDHGVSASNGYLASLVLTGGSMSSTGGGAFHINAGASKTISSLASSTTSFITANIAIRGANSVLPISVADGTAANDLCISGAITNSPLEAGANGVQKTGAGTLTLSGANTYTGATTVNGGTLVYTAAPSTIGSVITSSSAGLRVQAAGSSTTTLTSTSLTLGAGSPLIFDLNGLSPVSPLIATGTFTTSGAVGITILNGGALSAGTYKLVSYTSFAGGGTFSGASFPIGPRSTGTLSNNGTNGLYLTVTGGDKALWTGLDSGNWQTASTGANKNWKLQTAGTAIDYLEGDNVLFNDTATGTTTVTIAANISPVVTTFNNSTKSYTVNGGAGIAGAGGLTKSGTNTLTLSTANTFTGSVTHNGGTLYANIGNAANNRAFSYVGGIIVNSGATLRSSSNALFGWDGTQDKPITVSAGGTLTANGGLLSDVGVGTVTLNGGTLATLAGGATDYGSWRFDNAGDKLLVTENSIVSAQNVKFGDASAAIDVAAGKTLSFTGTVTNTTNGGISYLAKAGAGTLLLSGANTFSGGSTITGGAVWISANNHLGADSSPVSLNGATLKTTNTSALGISHPLTIGESGNTLNIAGNGAGTIGQGARVYFSAANTILGNGTLTLTGGGTLNGAAPNTQVAGVGALVIGGSNSYSGNVTLQNGGMIEYAAANALGSATVTLGNEGEFTVTNGTNAGNPIVVSGGTNSILSFSNAAGTSSGPITLNAGLTVGLRNWYNYGGIQNGTISGAISGTSGLVVHSGTGSGGTLTLSGSNTFTGSVTVANATMAAGTGIANFGAPAAQIASNLGDLGVGGRTITVNSGGVLSLTGGNVLGVGTSDNTLSGVTLVVNAGGVFQTGLNGSGSGWWNKIGAVNLNSGTIHVGSGGNTTTFQSLALIGTVTVGGSAASTIDNFAGSDDTTNGVHLGQNATAGQSVTFNVADASGNTNADLTVTAKLLNTSASLVASGLRKTGPGTMLLAGANAYTGATIVTAGSLKLTGSLANGAVSVASGATFAGTGTVGGSIGFAANSVHAPGDSVGTQTISGLLSYANGSRVKWALLTNSNAAGTSSRIAAGNVTVTAGAALDLVLNGPGGATDFSNSFWAQPRSWTVMTGSAITGGFTLGTVSADSAGHPASSYGSFSLQQNTTSVSLVFTPSSPTNLWRQANFGAGWNNPAISGDEVDGDHDGLSNLLEYALGSDPNVSGASGSPQVSSDSGKLKMIFTRNTAATDVTLAVTAADDLSSLWTEIASSVDGAAFTAVVAGATVNESGTGGTRIVQATDVYFTSDPAHPKRFMRLEVRR